MFKERLDRQVVPDEDLAPTPTMGRAAEFKNIFSSGNSPLPLDRRLSFRTEEMRFGRCCVCCPAETPEGGKPIAVKVYLPPSDDSLEVQEVTQRERDEYEGARKHDRLGVYIPEATFIVGTGINGKPSQISLQPWIEGKRIGDFTAGEILANPRLLYSLREITINSFRYFLENGEFLDSCGFGIKRELGHLSGLRSHSIFASRNLIWDGKLLHWVDPTLHSDVARLSKLRRFIFFTCPCFPAMAMDYLVTSVSLRTWSKGELSPEDEEEFMGNLAEIIGSLNRLRESCGLEYRVVGGVAVAAILGNKLSPFRGNSSKRDFNVVVLNPEVCQGELEELQKMAVVQAQRELFFPRLTITKVEDEMAEDLAKGPKMKLPPPFSWSYQAKMFWRNRKLHLGYRGFSISVPTEILSSAVLNYQGVPFDSFPQNAHYFLYITRNLGYVKGRDREKVKRLRSCSINLPLGSYLARLGQEFERSVGGRYPLDKMLNATRLEAIHLLGLG